MRKTAMSACNRHRRMRRVRPTAVSSANAYRRVATSWTLTETSLLPMGWCSRVSDRDTSVVMLARAGRRSSLSTPPGLR
jgi:hypothetical protein